MRNKFDMQLERLNEQLTHMGKLCEIAINKATMALQNGDMEQAKAFGRRMMRLTRWKRTLNVCA